MSRRSLGSQTSTTTLSSDTECLRKNHRRSLGIPRNNSSSDCESSLRLNRTTLLRQNKAKDVDKARPWQSDSLTSTTVSKPPKEKKKVRTSMERLNELSRPPARRMSRCSETESSDTESFSNLRSFKKRGPATPASRSRRHSRGSITTETEGSVLDTQRTNTSLGAKIVRKSRTNDSRPTRSGSLDRATYRSRRLESRRKSNTPQAYSDCASTSESELDSNNNNMTSSISTGTSLDTCTYNRSPPDGEMSDEIARASHDLARDLRILTSKSLDDLDSTLTSSSLMTSSTTTVATDADSLDQHIQPAVVIPSPPALKNDKCLRKTWS
uniref:Uncharacterized protein n=1 Tax=Ciona savignyi TaxID=51511 RepID=H2Z4S5_CIOSA